MTIDDLLRVDTGMDWRPILALVFWVCVLAFVLLQYILYANARKK